MSLIVGKKLKNLVDTGLVTGLPLDTNAVKSVHVDVRLDSLIYLETVPDIFHQTIIPGKDKLQLTEFDLFKENLILKPNQFALGGLKETISLPNNITGFFYLDSSLGRCGSDHGAAILIQPGWSGKLVLELMNAAQYHNLRFYDGMNIGKLMFMEHEEVEGYNGRFINQQEVRGN